jgi:hypothetical protein
MIRRTTWAVLVLASLAGCADSQMKPDAVPGTPSTTPSQVKVEDGKAADSKDGSKSEVEKITLSADEIEAINKLPDPEDRKAALAQKVCPVSWEPGSAEGRLGDMGMPIKKVINGKTIFICCKGCTEDIEKKTDEMLAKLKK